MTYVQYVVFSPLLDEMCPLDLDMGSPELKRDCKYSYRTICQLENGEEEVNIFYRQVGKTCIILILVILYVISTQDEV